MSAAMSLVSSDATVMLVLPACGEMFTTPSTANAPWEQAGGLYNIIQTDTIECTPLTAPPYAGLGLYLFCDENAYLKVHPSVNEVASSLLGTQVNGGHFLGTVVVALAVDDE